MHEYCKNITQKNEQFNFEILLIYNMHNKKKTYAE